MNYNPKEFAVRANKKAMTMWIMMSVVLSSRYMAGIRELTVKFVPEDNEAIRNYVAGIL